MIHTNVKILSLNINKTYYRSFSEVLLFRSSQRNEFISSDSILHVLVDHDARYYGGFGHLWDKILESFETTPGVQFVI